MKLFYLIAISTLFIISTTAQSNAIPTSKTSALANPIKVVLGSKYFLECTVEQNGKLIVKVVEEVVYPERTIIADFQYHEVFKSNLEVKNPFNKKLKYRAFIYYPQLKEWKETSIIPVYPKI